MFLHSVKYAFKGIVRERTGVFWACLFPFVMATLFHVSFGHINDEQYYEIAVGLVQGEASLEYTYFRQVLETVENEEGGKLFAVKELSEKKAAKLLEEEKLSGYFVADKELSLVVRENGIDQTILSTFLESYCQQASILSEVAKEQPKQLETAAGKLNGEHMFYNEINMPKGNMDSMVQYFYALIAMSCLFGCFLSFGRIVKLQANVSAIGMRRCVSPMKKSVAVLSEFLVCLVVQCMIGFLLLFYIMKVCHIRLGGAVPYMIPVIVVGSAFGVALGIFVGSFGGMSEAAKNAILLCVTLVLSFLSGLMFHAMKQIVEDHIPVLNRINPAALIADAMYALNVFEGMERYYRSLALLTVITVLLCVASVLQTRRTRYASL